MENIIWDILHSLWVSLKSIRRPGCLFRKIWIKCGCHSQSKPACLKLLHVEAGGRWAEHGPQRPESRSTWKPEKGKRVMTFPSVFDSIKGRGRADLSLVTAISRVKKRDTLHFCTLACISPFLSDCYKKCAPPSGRNYDWSWTSHGSTLPFYQWLAEQWACDPVLANKTQEVHWYPWGRRFSPWERRKQVFALITPFLPWSSDVQGYDAHGWGSPPRTLREVTAG